MNTLVKSIIFYFASRKATIVKFFIVSGSAVGINLILLFLMVRYFGFDNRFLENVANAVSMELSIIYNFFLSRAITWNDRVKEKGARLFVQILQFHLAIGVTIVFRLLLFPALQHPGVPYLLNAAIGIALAAIFNFFAYDAVVFKKRG